MSRCQALVLGQLRVLAVGLLAVGSACHSKKGQPAPVASVSAPLPLAAAAPVLASAQPVPEESASAGVAKPDPRLDDYCNPRFGFCVQYPRLLKEEPPPISGDGQTWSTPDGAIEMRAYGSYLSADTLQSLWKEATAADPDKTFTVKSRGATFFTVSYRSASSAKIHYEKTIFRQDSYAQFAVDYPAARRAEIDPLLGALQRSLSFDSGVGP